MLLTGFAPRRTKMVKRNEVKTVKSHISLIAGLDEDGRKVITACSRNRKDLIPVRLRCWEGD